MTQPDPTTRNPGWRAGASGTSAWEQRFHVQSATAEPLLQRLDGVQKSGNGWRARCPACGGKSRKVSIAEREGRVLIHAFCGCPSLDVLQAVGLSWGDVMPPRNWPESPLERRQARRAIRETGWASALAVLATEATVVRIAGRQLAGWQALSVEDDDRLARAVALIDGAAAVLVEAQAWRPTA